MAEVETIAPKAQEQIERAGTADLVVVLPGCGTREALHDALSVFRPALSAISPARKTAILYPETVPVADEPSPDASILLLPYPLSPVDRTNPETLERVTRALCSVTKSMGAAAGALISSEVSRATATETMSLMSPILDGGYDLAVPLYARRRYDRLINAAIMYPFIRAVYGARLQFPVAADVAISSRLADVYLRPSPIPGPSRSGSSRSDPLQSGWITTKAICANLEICEVRRGLAPFPPLEAAEISTVLAQVLSAMFTDAERNAIFWQKIRGSQPVRVFGSMAEVADDSGPVDVANMIGAYQRGCRDLLEIWGQVQSPGSLVELRKLSKAPAEQFRMPDELWVRVLYDALLGYRQRVINREHLLLAITPIYLAWVASYAIEVQNATSRAVSDRLERLCVSFESLKPYLLSRWRWPDRFNP